jgi:nucleotide-binding universal stress UspA family protein
MTTKKIVVGVDESTGAADALRWAVAEANLHDAELTAVLAWGFLDQHQSVLTERFDPSYGAEEAEAAVRSFVAAAIGNDPSSTVHAVAVCDLPARALLAASKQADLLVVGARGLGGFAGLLLGSVSQHCLHHSAVPVAIIRNLPDASERTPRVVVGVDGSDHAQHALRWAVEEARRRGAQLDVVTAWQLPYNSGLPATAAIDPIVFERIAEHALRDALTDEDLTGLAGEVGRRVVLGHPADVLLDAAAGADLLVVGSRGHGAFKRAVIGSVATHVSHHADCPVVVVPAPRDMTSR